jgi:hypothetical protein
LQGFADFPPRVYGQIVRLQHCVLPATRCPNTGGNPK